MLAARAGKGAAPRGGASSRARRGPPVAARALPPGPRANGPARPGRGHARGTAGQRRLGAGRAETLSCPSLARPLPAGRRPFRSPWRAGRAAARTRGRGGAGRSGAVAWCRGRGRLSLRSAEAAGFGVWAVAFGLAAAKGYLEATLGVNLQRGHSNRALSCVEVSTASI